MSKLINIRFDLVELISNKDKDRTGFFKTQSCVVPEKGEIVKIFGLPHIVIDRTWSYTSIEVQSNEETYCNIRVLKTYL